MIEGRNQAGELYGQERFEEHFLQNRSARADAVIRSLIADLESYLSDTEPEDDRAILCIDYRRNECADAPHVDERAADQPRFPGSGP